VDSAIDREADTRARLQEHVIEFNDGLVTHETQYFADPFDAPPGRAGLAETIPARDQ
jgi:hypothetical protein